MSTHQQHRIAGPGIHLSNEPAFGEVVGFGARLVTTDGVRDECSPLPGDHSGKGAAQGSDVRRRPRNDLLHHGRPLRCVRNHSARRGGHAVGKEDRNALDPRDFSVYDFECLDQAARVGVRDLLRRCLTASMERFATINVHR